MRRCADGGYERVSVLYDGGATVPTNAGTYEVTVNAAEGELFFAAEGIELGEYVIAAKPVTITGLTASNKDYDGAANTAVTGTPEVSGAVSGDAVTVVNIRQRLPVTTVPTVLRQPPPRRRPVGLARRERPRGAGGRVSAARRC